MPTITMQEISQLESYLEMLNEESAKCSQQGRSFDPIAFLRGVLEAKKEIFNLNNF